MSKTPFNKPALFVTLLSDNFHSNPQTHAVYSSVMSDEITLRTPDSLMTGQATSAFIQNCCPSIEEPETLLTCDIQHLLASIRIASQGAELTVDLRCPKCNEFDPYVLDLQQLLPMLSAKLWMEPMIVDGFHLEFRPPTYKEYTQFVIEDFKINKQLHQIAKAETPENYSSIAASLLDKQRELHLKYQAGCIAGVSSHPFNYLTYGTDDSIATRNPEYILEWFMQCEVGLQKKIVDRLVKAKKETAIADFKVICTGCHHPFTAPIDLDPCTQFRQKLIPASNEEVVDIIKKMGQECKDLANDLLKMIWFMRGSISYSEAYALTPYERQCIAKIIEQNIEATKESKMPLI